MPCNTRNNNNTPAICCTGGNASERTCIEVDKVFDACISQFSVIETLEVDFEGDTTGYTVTSVQSSGETTLTDVVITPILGSACSRVRYTATVPVTVVATNAAGAQIVGT